jgi:hypothetical protein
LISPDKREDWPVYERLAKAYGDTTAQACGRFVSEDFDKIELSRDPMLVKGTLARVGLCFLVGSSGSGKTFFALRLCASVARGESFFGRRTTQSGVVYIAAEDPGGVRNRIVGLRQEIGDMKGAFHFIGAAPDLLNPDDLQQLRAAITQRRAHMATLDLRLGLVVLDTFSSSIPGADENSSSDMSAVVTALQALATELGLLVLVVAHTGKDSTKGLRGWSGLTANADGTIFLDDPEEDGRRGGVVRKVKNGRAGMRFAFDLREVELGLDDDGDMITTLIADEAAEPASEPFRKAPLKPQAQTVMKAFNRLHEAAETVPIPIRFPGIMPGAQGVMLADLRSKAIDLNLVAEPKPPESDKAAMTRWKSSNRTAFSRAVDELKTTGRLRVEEEYVWDPSERRMAA